MYFITIGQIQQRDCLDNTGDHLYTIYKNVLFRLGRYIQIFSNFHPLGLLIL